MLVQGKMSRSGVLLFLDHRPPQGFLWFDPAGS